MLSNMESLVRRAAEWDQQTGNWKDDLQPSSCPNSHCRANMIPVRHFLSPVSISLCSPVCSTLILPLYLCLSEQHVEEIARQTGGVLQLNLPCLLSSCYLST